MTGKEAYERQIAEIKAHMGELRSADGKSVERLLAARAAEPTYSQTRDAAGVLESEWVANNHPHLLAQYMGQWIAVKGETVVAAASDIVRLKELLDMIGVHNPYIRRIEPDTFETNIFQFSAWDGLFAWGDGFQQATSITREDIDRAIEEVRRGTSDQHHTPADSRKG